MDRRHWVGAIAAAGAIGATALLVPRPDPAPVAQARAQEPAADKPAFAAELARAAVPGMHSDPFSTQQPARAAIPEIRNPQAIVEVPVPQAPAFPYKYAGRLDREGGKAEVYLTKGSELLTITAGQVLDAAWRIDSISADRLQVTWVPGGQTSMLALSSLVSEPGAPQPAVVADAIASETHASIAGEMPLLQQAQGGIAARGSIGQIASAPQISASGGAVGATPTSPASARAPAATSGAINAQGPVPTGTLGSEAPSSGSMPTGPAPSSAARLGL